jgi:hypothetical protein
MCYLKPPVDWKGQDWKEHTHTHTHTQSVAANFTDPWYISHDRFKKNEVAWLVDTRMSG